MEVVKDKLPKDKAPKNKVTRKHVSILKSELTKKNVSNSDHPKWKQRIIKLLKLEVRDKYQYLFRITYKGMVKLRPNDIVINSDGAVFLVLQEANRMAMIVSKDSFHNKPKVYGTLTIIDNLKSASK